MADAVQNILFVCTGNTCRSPMAEAIAQHLVAATPDGRARVRTFSAGVAAAEGAPMTIEAEEALRRLGVDPGSHHALSVNADMVAKADRVFTMTNSHRQRLLELVPGAAGKVFTLDPDGRDLPDPIGHPQRTYDETAREIRRLVERRLREAMQ